MSTRRQLEAEALALGTIRSGSEQPPIIEAMLKRIRARMSWPSMHWGRLHDDAWPHIAEAALTGLLDHLAEQPDDNEAELTRLRLAVRSIAIGLSPAVVKNLDAGARWARLDARSTRLLLAEAERAYKAAL
jgi:hypothetical protein